MPKRRRPAPVPASGDESAEETVKVPPNVEDRRLWLATRALSFWRGHNGDLYWLDPRKVKKRSKQPLSRLSWEWIEVANWVLLCANGEHPLFYSVTWQERDEPPHLSEELAVLVFVYNICALDPEFRCKHQCSLLMMHQRWGAVLHHLRERAIEIRKQINNKGATVPGKRATAEKEVRKHYAYAESGPLSVMEVLQQQQEEEQLMQQRAQRQQRQQDQQQQDERQQQQQQEQPHAEQAQNAEQRQNQQEAQADVRQGENTGDRARQQRRQQHQSQQGVQPSHAAAAAVAAGAGSGGGAGAGGSAVTGSQHVGGDLTTGEGEEQADMDAEGPLDAGAALAGPAAHNPQGMAGEIQAAIDVEVTRYVLHNTIMRALDRMLGNPNHELWWWLVDALNRDLVYSRVPIVRVKATQPRTCPVLDFLQGHAAPEPYEYGVYNASSPREGVDMFLELGTGIAYTWHAWDIVQWLLYNHSEHRVLRLRTQRPAEFPISEQLRLPADAQSFAVGETEGLLKPAEEGWCVLWRVSTFDDDVCPPSSEENRGQRRARP